MDGIRDDLRAAWRALTGAWPLAAAISLLLWLGIGITVPLLGVVREGLRGGVAAEAPLGLPTLPDGGAGAGPSLGTLSADRFETSFASVAVAADPVPRTVAAAQGTDARGLLRTFGAAALLALVLTSGSVLLLLLARASRRRNEVVMRAVLGATRGRLRRQLLLEAAVLAGVGVAGGALLAVAIRAAVRASWPEAVPYWVQPVEPWLVGPMVAVPLLALFLGALAPVRGAREAALHRELQAGARVTPGRAEGGVRRGLGIVALAAAAVLLVGSGVLLRAAAPEPGSRSPGYDPRDTVTLQLDLAGAGDRDLPARAGLLDAVLDSVARVRGVRTTSAASQGAWVGLGTEGRVLAVCGECWEGAMPRPITVRPARHHSVSPGYFATLGIPLLRGREFTPADGAGAEGVVVVSRAFAARLFPNGEPLGKQVRAGGSSGAWYRVVGVVDEVRAAGIGSGSEPVPAIYFSALQRPPLAVGVAVRSAGDPAGLAPLLRAAIHRVDPRVDVREVDTLDGYLARFEAPVRGASVLFGVLGALSALVAAGAVYGVIAQGISRRTREVGIRMAVGSSPGAVVRMILRETARLAGLGLLLGGIGAVSLARALQLALQGVRPLDPVVYLAVGALLLGVALLAGFVPARRASRLHPTAALAAE